MGAEDRGWGHPRSERDDIVGIRVAGVEFPGGVNERVQPIMAHVAERFHKEVERLRDGWCWGYSYRHIAGTNTWSNHAWGLALDLNAPRHPYGASGTFSGRQERRIRRVCDGLNVRWGGDYRGTKDEMHFEFMGTPGEADDIARQLRRGGRGTAGGGNDVDWVNREKGDEGHAVRVIQAILNTNLGGKLKEDGIYGPATEREIREFQRWASIAVDGVVGPQTYRHLLYSNIRGDQVPGHYG